MTKSISKEEKTIIFEHLLAYNLNHIEDKNPKELGIFADEENGRRMGGLLGSTHGNWLQVDFLWVDEEARGKGIGSVLLEKAEDEARNRGCRYVFLDTFSFQAPGFYTKKGYEQVFVLEEYPRTGKRFYYTKELVQEKAEGQRDNRQRLREFFQAENERNWKVYEQFIARISCGSFIRTWEIQKVFVVQELICSGSGKPIVIPPLLFPVKKWLSALTEIGLPVCLSMMPGKNPMMFLNSVMGRL